MALIERAAQQTLNGIRHFAGRATIAHRSAKACVLTHSAAKTEVVSILNAAIDLQFLAFQSDIGNAVLAATIRAAGYVELQLLIELRDAFFQLFNQPAGESLGFC